MYLIHIFKNDILRNNLRIKISNANKKRSCRNFENLNTGRQCVQTFCPKRGSKSSVVIIESRLNNIDYSITLLS